MIDWLLASVPYLKALHIVTLFVWCAGLIALPLMLAHHDPANTQHDYQRIRRATHLTYTMATTPAAVAAVIAGTWLIFLRRTFEPWFYAKLFFVVILVSGHAWVGHILVRTGETLGRHRPPPAFVPITVLLIPILVILVLVLGKPEIELIEVPGWLAEPRGGQLPFDVPRR